MGKKPETRFKERIRPLLEALPRSWWVKVQMVAVLGIPDFLGCVNGHFIAIELKKSEDDEPTELQAWVLAKIRAAGGIGICVSPEAWDEAYKMLVRMSTGRAVYKPQIEPAEKLDS